MRLKIAARKSDLARLQAFLVGDALKAAHPKIHVSYEFRASLGDLNQNDPLWKMPEKGVFTQDFYDDLVNGKCDMVVHSWKDLPIGDKPATQISGTLKRADLRDLLLVKKSHLEKVAASRRLQVLSSSPRREYNLSGFLKAHWPNGLDRVLFEPVRGNVPTRVRKLIEGSLDALIVAKAALDRLLSAPQDEFRETQAELRRHLELCDWMVLPLSENPSAAAQGALAIEIKRGRSDLEELLAEIHCPDTYRAVVKERETLARYGGGCHQKIGVSILARPFGDVRFLKGLTDKGEVLDSIELTSRGGPAPKPESLDRVFPLEPKQASWFERRPIAAARQDDKPLWVARADALPADWSPRSLVWTAGLETWRKLAARGVWVNGSAEGLGESEPARIETLAFGPVAWIKLSHDEGHPREGQEFVATYRLEPKNDVPDLNGKTHFYWMSGSGFLRAVQHYPWLRNANHFCGPGSTYAVIQQNLGPQGRVFVS
ncbi:MAG TPA: hydroxymethylbilane synthase, partial [Bdellovibrionales bacterium]|nr:hydroxymethylbilane synthase [Bdellovibrionales bacterium]